MIWVNNYFTNTWDKVTWGGSPLWTGRVMSVQSTQNYATSSMSSWEVLLWQRFTKQEPPDFNKHSRLLLEQLGGWNLGLITLCRLECWMQHKQHKSWFHALTDWTCELAPNTLSTNGGLVFPSRKNHEKSLNIQLSATRWNSAALVALSFERPALWGL